MQLVKEREVNFEDYVLLDKNNASRKAFELLSNLNDLLKSGNEGPQAPFSANPNFSDVANQILEQFD